MVVVSPYTYDIEMVASGRHFFGVSAGSQVDGHRLSDVRGNYRSYPKMALFRHHQRSQYIVLFVPFGFNCAIRISQLFMNTGRNNQRFNSPAVVLGIVGRPPSRVVASQRTFKTTVVLVSYYFHFQ